MTLFYRLMKKRVAFVCKNNEQDAFTSLRIVLCNIFLVIYLHFNKSFLLQIDMSQDAIGAILSQIIKDQEYVVTYTSS